MRTRKPEQTGNSDCLFVTSDEHIFYEREKAIMHANKLQDKSLKPLTRQAADEMATGITATNNRTELEDFLDALTGN